MNHSRIWYELGTSPAAWSRRDGKLDAGNDWTTAMIGCAENRRFGGRKYGLQAERYFHGFNVIINVVIFSRVGDDAYFPMSGIDKQA